MNVIETSGLGKRYGKSWALQDCTLTVPAGHLAALVGPNGAGKSTLMNMTAGLTVPTSGTATVLGGHPAGSPAALNGVAFVAQDAPVYRNLSAGDMLHLTRNLNQQFDTAFARARLADLGIPLGKKAGKLSGGQQSQLALTLALARRPRLLILDEPLASLDPLARQDFLAAVMAAMADDGVSVLLSSHAVAELERVADYLIVLSRARLQLSGEVDDVLGRHRLLTGPTVEADAYASGLTVVQARRGGAQTHLLVRTSGTDDLVPPGWESHPVGVEELVMAHLRAAGERASGEDAPGQAEAVFPGPVSAGPSLVQPAGSTEVVR
jgi:ABC-2 type transport system ATP-binding protein